MRSRRSRRSLKLSHTQTSVPCGTLKYADWEAAEVKEITTKDLNTTKLWDKNVQFLQI